MEYYSAMKKEHTIAVYNNLVDLKDIMPREKSQYPKVTWCMISFIWHPQRGKVLELENRLRVRDSGQQAGGYKKSLW